MRSTGPHKQVNVTCRLGPSPPIWNLDSKNFARSFKLLVASNESNLPHLLIFSPTVHSMYLNDLLFVNNINSIILLLLASES